MRISELIAALEHVLSENGDLEVSSGYQDYPAGYAGISAVTVEDQTDRSLGGKRFALIGGKGPMVAEE